MPKQPTDAPTANFPLNVRPMVCKLVRDPFSRRGWIFEIKWDGFRTIAEIDGSGVKLYSRKQNSFTTKFAEITKSLEGLGHRAVLDGEVVALDDEGHSRFEWLFRRNGSRSKGRLIYYVLICCIWMEEIYGACPCTTGKPN